MGLGSLLYFATQLISLIDSGKHQDISVDEVKGHIDKGDLLPYLDEKLGNDIDLSIFMPETDLGAPEDMDMDTKEAKEWITIQVRSSKFHTERAEALIDGLQRRRNVISDEGAGIRIKNSGLCFLLSSIIGLIGSKE